MSRLLKALAARESDIAFKCSATGIDLVARSPNTAERIAAAQYAQKLAAGIEGMGALLAVQRGQDAALVASCVSEQGKPLGQETVAELPDPLVSEYASWVQLAIDGWDPDTNTLTDDEIKLFEDAIKKKELPSQSRSYDISTLRNCISFLVNALENCETSRSSNGGSAARVLERER